MSHRNRIVTSAILAAATPTATAAAASTAAATATTTSSTPYTCETGASVDCTKLPLGDKKYTTAGPLQGSIYVCSNPGNGQPVVATAPWLNAVSNTWNTLTKVAVSGSVAFTGSFAATLSADGSTRALSGNGLPSSPYTAGVFPIQLSDPAYVYDRNPGTIAAQPFSFTVPGAPAVATTPSCVSAGGTIAVTTTGVAIYNAFDANGYDGVAHEVQDACHGHPDPSSTYHYHGFIQTCSHDGGSLTMNSSLIGYALDGFGIYGPWYNGKMLASADLDACHGTTSPVMWDGKLVTIYHYVSTYDFPYTIACYRGTPVRLR